jgi:hypothetical protein
MEQAMNEWTNAKLSEWTNAKLCDVANLILGAILFASPWMFAFAAGAESQNAYASGIVIVVLSIAALAAFAVWEEWLNLIVGLWVMVSPWVLGFQGSQAMTVNVVIGILVAALAAIELWIMHQGPSQRTVAS